MNHYLFQRRSFVATMASGLDRTVVISRQHTIQLAIFLRSSSAVFLTHKFPKPNIINPGVLNGNENLRTY